MIRVPGWYLICILGASLPASAQSVNLSGVILNNNQQTIAGAVVTLIGLDLIDTTDASGAFAFMSTGTFTAAPVYSARQNITFSKGVLSINITSESLLSIELFDFRGRLLDRIIRSNTNAGEYRFNVADHPYASKMLLLRVYVGTECMVFRYMPSISGFDGNRELFTSSGGTLAKILATVDTIKVVASGYVETAVGIESYESVKNISLEKMPVMDKFSFFVTSMEGLQHLSGSEDGFGGDLRFGKTGPGAGLLGADSICSCLAEISMPGSSAKKWSAFLSAEKGVDGNQVNAIDRIGDGPWYDRLGRLIANNKSELLNTRPLNADPDIIDDLPNEFGIPNHRPDPTQKEVDNHMTVTGSDSLGRLYTGSSGSDGFEGWRDDISGESEEGYTCNDWTSTTVRARPRVGFCWPQASGGHRGFPKTAFGGTMKHWISVMNASGCEAGIDLSYASMSGTPGVYTIGNGGGYGGFYCFAHQE